MYAYRSFRNNKTKRKLIVVCVCSRVLFALKPTDKVFNAKIGHHPLLDVCYQWYTSLEANYANDQIVLFRAKKSIFVVFSDCFVNPENAVTVAVCI